MSQQITTYKTTPSMTPSSKKARTSAKKPRKTNRSLRRSVVLNPSSSKSYIPRAGFPPQLVFRHRYAESVTLTSTTGSFATHFFKANGMYDTNQTGVGHQPMFFDNLTAVYDHWCVVSSKITVRAAPQAGVNTNTEVCLTIMDQASTSATTTRDVREAGTAVSKLLAPLGTDPVVLTKTWSAKYFSDDFLSNSELQGTSASDPTELSYFMIAVQNWGAATVQVQCFVDIEFTAIWKEVRSVAIN